MALIFSNLFVDGRVAPWARRSARWLAGLVVAGTGASLTSLVVRGCSPVWRVAAAAPAAPRCAAPQSGSGLDELMQPGAADLERSDRGPRVQTSRPSVGLRGAFPRSATGWHPR